jgi:hypothetical protein
MQPSFVIKDFNVLTFSNNEDEPFHMHLIKGNGIAKIWLCFQKPIIAWAYNFSKAEVNEIVEKIDNNAPKILKQKGIQVPLINNYDCLEAFIYEEGLRIETIDFYPELDLMLIVLNTKAVLQQQISAYKLLKSADATALKEFELIGNGTGVHWPSLDEDLSLKGFLKDELKKGVSEYRPKAA